MTSLDRKRRLSAVLRAVAVLAMATVGAADAAPAVADIVRPPHQAVTYPAPSAPLSSGAAQQRHQAVGDTASWPSGPASQVNYPAALVAAPVAHPNNDFMGSTIAAHEGKQSPPSVPPHPGATMPGLDVSNHQGTVNWEAVAAAGATFAYLKATEGTTFVDGQFGRNFAGSYAAGLFRGAYHFALPDRSSGATQANFFVDHGGTWAAGNATLPPVIDMEYNPYGPTCYGLSNAQMSAWVADFSNTVHNRTNRWPMIYTTTNWWSTCAGTAATSATRTDPLWLARYSTGPGALPADWSFYTVWQYNDAGTYPGDQDVFSGSIDELGAFAGSGAPIALRNPQTGGPSSVPSGSKAGQPPAVPVPPVTTTAPAPTPTPSTPTPTTPAPTPTPTPTSTPTPTPSTTTPTPTTPPSTPASTPPPTATNSSTKVTAN